MADPSTFASFRHGHNFGAAIATSHASGGVEITGCRTIRKAGSGDYVPTIGTPTLNAYDEGWYPGGTDDGTDANAMWIVGTGIDRAMSIRGVGGASPYPGGPNTTGVSQGGCFFLGPATFDPRAFSLVLVFANSIRGTDLSTETGESTLFSLADKVEVRITPSGYIKIAVAGTGATGGGTSTVLAHAGTNVLVIRSDGTTVKIDTFHTGRADITATPGSGASALLYLCNSSGGGNRFYGRIYADRLHNAALSDAETAEAIAFFAAEYGCVEHQHLAMYFGDSWFQGTGHKPGYSIPHDHANANPTHRVLNFAFSAATGVAGANSFETQVTRALAVLSTAAIPGGGKVGVCFFGLNDMIAGSGNVTNTLAAISSNAALLRAAGCRVVAATPVLIAQVAANEATIEARETEMQAIRTGLLAAVGGNIDAVADYKAEFTITTPPVHTDVIAIVVDNHEWWVNNGNSDLVADSAADSADGLHSGVYGNIACGTLISTVVTTVLAMPLLGGGNRSNTARRLLLGV